MKYQSTRGIVKDCTFEDALFSGFLSDGGIMLPQSIPTLDKETMKSWAKLSYTDLVKKVLPYFISPEDIPTDDLHGKL